MKRIAIGAGVCAMMFGCSGGNSLETLAERSREAIEARAPVVVFLPGTLASRLRNRETGEVVWGGDDSLSLDPRTEGGLRQLSLPMSPAGSDRAAAPDPIGSAGVLRRAATRILGIRFSIGIYEKPLDALGSAGLVETPVGVIPDDGPTLTPFSYDWRRSIVDGAQALGAALDARGEEAEKVVLVGHSMGGTVALHYLMYGGQPLDTAEPLPPVTWAGARHVKRAILVAPPLRGSPVAIRNTVNGNKLGGPLIPTYPPVMLATHPSSFELMPRGDAGALRNADGAAIPGGALDPALWQRRGWGLTGPEVAKQIGWLTRGAPDGREMAARQQAKLIERAEVFHSMFDRGTPAPEGLDIVVIAGKGRETPAAVRITEDGVEVVAQDDGDSVVLYGSATAGARERGFRVIDVSGEHAYILSDAEAFESLLREISR